MKAYPKGFILRASLAVAVLTLATRCIGYLEKLTVAYFWGTGTEADAYNAVLAVVTGFFFLFREVVEPGALNLLVRTRTEKGENESWKAFASIFLPTAVLGGAAALAVSCWPEEAVALFLPGFREEAAAAAARLFALAGPAVLFLMGTTVTQVSLLSYKYFTAAALSDLAYKSCILLGLLVFYRRYGLDGTLIGLGIGAVLRLAWHFLRLRPRMTAGVLHPEKHYLRTFLAASWPLLVGNLFSQAGGFADNAFASCLEKGAISALSFARKVTELPVVLFPYTLSIVVFPFFTQLSAEKDTARLDALLAASLKYVLLAFLPLSFFLFFFPDPVIGFIFQRGAFDAQSTFLTARAFAIYNLGLPAFALEALLVVFLFGRGRIREAVLIGIACVSLDILLTWAGVGRIGYRAVAWSLVISKWTKTLILLWTVRRSLALGPDFWKKALGRVGPALAIFCAVVVLCRFSFYARLETLTEQFAALSGIFLAGGLPYVLLLNRAGLFNDKSFDHARR